MQKITKMMQKKKKFNSQRDIITALLDGDCIYHSSWLSNAFVTIDTNDKLVDQEGIEMFGRGSSARVKAIEDLFVDPKNCHVFVMTKRQQRIKHLRDELRYLEIDERHDASSIQEDDE